MSEHSLSRLKVVSKDGKEPFCINGQDLGFDLGDFWRWSVSDLVSNATRGRLAEFIVVKALGIPTTDEVRDEWGAFDLTTPKPEAIKVEVKSAAYLQSWYQRSLSKISFAIPKTRYWDPDKNEFLGEARRQADVYVFALLAHQEKSTINPLDVAQWDFYVLPTKALDERPPSQDSITLAILQKLTAPVHYHQLQESVKMAATAVTGSTNVMRTNRFCWYPDDKITISRSPVTKPKATLPASESDPKGTAK